MTSLHRLVITSYIISCVILVCDVFSLIRLQEPTVSAPLEERIYAVYFFTALHIILNLLLFYGIFKRNHFIVKVWLVVDFLYKIAAAIMIIYLYCSVYKIVQKYDAVIRLTSSEKMSFYVGPNIMTALLVISFCFWLVIWSLHQYFILGEHFETYPKNRKESSRAVHV